MSVCIVGWGHTKFGKLEEQGLEDLLMAAAQKLWKMPMSQLKILMRFMSPRSMPACRNRISSHRWLCRSMKRFVLPRPRGLKMPAAQARRRCFKRPI